MRVLVVDGDNFGKAKALSVKRNFDASFETQEDDFDILLTTDKLSEGFNLNRAGLVVNYDIPWNPTRVIQRVGRINRIGKKVFENLYIFNFFPTIMGSTIAQNRQIAEAKMFAIHQILGEDAQIFSVEEEPRAAALFDKFSANLDDRETVGFYTKMRKEYAFQTNFLEKNHPETFERIRAFPPMVKTAWAGNPHATFLFRRQGPGFFAIANQASEGTISEWSFEEAFLAIQCKFTQPREPFSDGFWSTRQSDGTKREGTYDRLKSFKPDRIPASSNLSISVQAIAALENVLPQLSHDLQGFATDVIEDIGSYGTIPQATLLRIVHAAGSTAASIVSDILEDIRRLRGANYIERERRRAAADSIVVTIEKH